MPIAIVSSQWMRKKAQSWSKRGGKLHRFTRDHPYYRFVRRSERGFQRYSRSSFYQETHRPAAEFLVYEGPKLAEATYSAYRGDPSSLTVLATDWQHTKDAQRKRSSKSRRRRSLTSKPKVRRGTRHFYYYNGKRYSRN